MVLTVLEPEGLYPDTIPEQEILGPGVRMLQGNAKTSLADLPDALCAEVDGLMTLRMWVPAEQIARFPKLKVIVRMGVGYDRVDRAAAAARGITVCNLPDYGTQEVAEFAVLLAVSLRRGLILYHDTQRGPSPAPWAVMPSAIVRRQEVQTFGILGLGRIGVAAALRAKAFGYRVVFYDPNQPNGWDRAVGIQPGAQHGRAAGAIRRAVDPLPADAGDARADRGAGAAAAAEGRRRGEYRARADPRHRCAGALPARRPPGRRRARRDPGGAAGASRSPACCGPTATRRTGCAGGW